mmetsp:Transcript_22492/g.41404  ORF Transcript_22492/g.41404 Transcript_22492/m.41404 type:complete len:202 (+) Transcript_22492:821-1426(+)
MEDFTAEVHLSTARFQMSLPSSTCDDRSPARILGSRHLSSIQWLQPSSLLDRYPRTFMSNRPNVLVSPCWSNEDSEMGTASSGLVEWRSILLFLWGPSTRVPSSGKYKRNWLPVFTKASPIVVPTLNFASKIAIKARSRDPYPRKSLPIERPMGKERLPAPSLGTFSLLCSCSFSISTACFASSGLVKRSSPACSQTSIAR